MRDNIINILRKYNSLNLMDLSNKLNFKDFKALTKELDSLVSDGVIFISKKNKYVLIENDQTLKVGIIKINKNKDAYLEDTDIFIKRRNLNYSIDKDKVLVHLMSSTEAKVVTVLERNLNYLTGVIEKGKFIPSDKKIDLNISINKSDLSKYTDGSVVKIKLSKLNSKNKYIGTIEKYIGNVNDPGIDILSVASEYNIDFEFSKKSILELERISTKLRDSHKKDRLDLTNDFLVTLDGESAKDLDDAISITKEGNLYKLGVHIADVSFYIKEGMSLYSDALKRGNSYYLADKVIPMLPFKISNGICSLTEGEDRLATSVFMYFDTSLNLIKFDIKKSVINSKRRLTYEHVNEVLEGKKEDVNADFFHLALELSDKLREKYIKRGYISFFTEEAEIILDKDEKCIDIKKTNRGISEEVIESFMISANEVVAEYLKSVGKNSIYRVHEKPDVEEVEKEISFFESLDINLGVVNASNSFFQKALTLGSEKLDRTIVSDILLKSMKKAKYDASSNIHFGLASKTYTHFTAPIRRFSDLVVHEVLSNVLAQNNFDFSKGKLKSICEIINERELASISAERKIFKLKSSEFMAGKIGEVFPGIISGVTNFGLFVKLDNLVEGLVPISSLDGYFEYSEVEKALKRKDSNTFYKLGHHVKIKVVGVIPEEGIIDFEVCDGD